VHTRNLNDLVAQPAHRSAEVSAVGALGPGEQRRARHDQSDDRDRHAHGGDQRGRVAADKRQAGDRDRGQDRERDQVDQRLSKDCAENERGKRRAVSPARRATR
jgi:hypothetical protein